MPSRPAAWRVLLFLVAVDLAAAPLRADQPEFCVGGTVLNAQTGEPLRRAAVTIPEAAALTDAAGAFRFCSLPAGAYYANAEKPGFVAAGASVVVGPSRENVVLRLQPLCVIGGKVADAAGEPAPNVLVQLLAIQVAEGRRKVRVESAVAADDRGEYRLAGLSAGRYYLRVAGWEGATGNPDEGEAFAPVYYGGAAELASAAPVRVRHQQIAVFLDLVPDRHRRHVGQAQRRAQRARTGGAASAHLRGRGRWRSGTNPGR